MKAEHLSEYVDKFDQYKAATELGITQGAVSHIKTKNRDVFVVATKTGIIKDAYEVKKIGRFAK